MTTMTINEFAGNSPLPRKVLLYLNRQGAIHDPLRREDLIGLHFLERVWGSKEVLRPQLAKLSMKARLSLIRTAALQTKWERYAYSRFRNHKDGKKLAMQSVIEEIEVTFSFTLSQQHIRRLYKIRNRAQVARHREKIAAKLPGPLLHCANK